MTPVSAVRFVCRAASVCKVLAIFTARAFCIVGLPACDLNTYKMILTQCAVCATELGLSLGKKCGRCSTRYCGAECQVQHWKEGGHDTLCKKIKKAGGAEQYNANKKYAEAVSVAVEKCAEDTKGQTCYICTQALHWKTKEGLVRGCSCRGTAGFAHVSCLAEQAKILIARPRRTIWATRWNERWHRWHTCSLCEQQYHGVVSCALGGRAGRHARVAVRTRTTNWAYGSLADWLRRSSSATPKAGRTRRDFRASDASLGRMPWPALGSNTGGHALKARTDSDDAKLYPDDGLRDEANDAGAIPRNGVAMRALRRRDAAWCRHAPRKPSMQPMPLADAFSA